MHRHIARFNLTCCNLYSNALKMSSSECAQLHHDHGHVMDRLKRRFGTCQQHSQDCQARQAATQQQLAENERLCTAMLHQKAQENKAKKPGKYNKTDPVRTKQLTDQSNDARNDASDVNVRLKRKLESGSACSNTALIQPSMNGSDSTGPPSGNMSNFINGQHSNQEFAAKKMKIDANTGFTSSINHQGSGNTNFNGGTSLSVQIVQQISSEQQPRIETTVNVNTSLNSNMGRPTDKQSVSVNVDSKDIKQESQENSYVNQNTFVNANMNADASHASGQQTNNDIGDMDFNEHDFDAWLEQISQNPSVSSGMTNFDMSTQDPQQQSSTPQSQQQQQQDNQMSHDAQTLDKRASNSARQFSKSNNFQCKTEKIDYVGFGSEPNSDRSKSHNIFSNNENQSSNAALSGAGMSGCDAAKSPFSAGQTVHHQQIISSGGNNSMTSQHIQKLQVSVQSKFHVMPDQHAQHPSQQHNMQGNPQPVHRTTPTGMEKMRHTPDLASSRLSHQPGHSMAKSMSPSSVSYSVTHQPHPGLAAGMSNAEPSPYFGSLQHNQMSGQVMGGVGSHGMQRPRMQMPGAASDMSPHFNSALPRHGTPGLNSGMGGQGLPGPAMSRSHSQQLKALADKKQDRFPAGVGTQWSSSASASMNMASNMSFDNQSISQQQHMSADMQSYTSYRGSGPMMYSATTANPGSVPPNNFSAASAAAEQVEAYARNQHQQSLHNAANRLTHYPADAQFVGSHMPPTGMGMTTKPIHANGNISHGQMHAVMMQAKSNQFKNSSTGFRVNEAGFGPRASLVRGAHRQPGIGTGAAAAAVMNSSAAVNMRMQQTSTLTSNQQRQMLQQKYMMEQHQMNSKPMVASPASGSSLYNASNALPRHGLPAQMHGMQRQPQASSRMFVGSSDGIQNHSTSQGWASNLSPNPSGMSQGSTPVWNRSLRPQVMNNQMRIPSGVNMNTAPNHATAPHGGYQTMIGGHQRLSMTSSMTMSGTTNHLEQNVMNQGQVMGSMPHHHQNMAGMGGAEQQRSNVFSPGIMVGGNNAMLSMAEQGYPGQMPLQQQHVNGNGDRMYHVSSSTDNELNLIYELLDGK